MISTLSSGRKIIPRFFSSGQIGRAALKAKVSKAPTGTKKKIVHEVETDTNQLVNFVCGLNYRTDDSPGEEVPIKPDSEYPEWLFTMDLSGRRKPLSEIPEGTIEYYERLRKDRKAAFNSIQKRRKGFKYIEP